MTPQYADEYAEFLTTAPTNLTVTSTTETSVALAWGPSTDNSGKFNYVIAGGPTNVIVSQTQTSHTLTALQAGKTYTFRVYARDLSGNLSKSSNAATGNRAPSRAQGSWFPRTAIRSTRTRRTHSRFEPAIPMATTRP